MKALDIVLLLPRELNQEVIAMNQSVDHPNRVIDFDRDGTHPHISLCMLVVNDAELEEL